MTHPTHYAKTQPDKTAYVMAGTGKAITYRELDERSNQGAHLFRALGLKAGDHMALLMENRLEFMEICWAAQRAGLYFTAISRYLTQAECRSIFECFVAALDLQDDTAGVPFVDDVGRHDLHGDGGGDTFNNRSGFLSRRRHTAL